MDLVAQHSATSSRPAVAHVRVYAPQQAEVGVRVYPPVSSRADLMSYLSGSIPAAALAEWSVLVPPARRAQPRDSDGTTSGDGAGAFDDLGGDGIDSQWTAVSLPLAPDGGYGAAGGGDGGVRPAVLELRSVDGSVLEQMVTFITPAQIQSVQPLRVAVMLDLRMSAAHGADGGASFDDAVLGRALGLAEVAAERRSMPLNAEITPETLDALALIGDSESLALLRDALEGRHILRGPWTSLNIDEWVRAGRADVVLDGLRRGDEAMRLAGLPTNTVIGFDAAPTQLEADLMSDQAAGAEAFLIRPRPAESPAAEPVAVTRLAESSADRRLMGHADPLLAAMLRHDDTELAAQWAVAELLRMAGSGEHDGVIVYASATPGPAHRVICWRVSCWHSER